MPLGSTTPSSLYPLEREILGSRRGYGGQKGTEPAGWLRLLSISQSELLKSLPTFRRRSIVPSTSEHTLWEAWLRKTGEPNWWYPGWHTDQTVEVSLDCQYARVTHRPFLLFLFSSYSFPFIFFPILLFPLGINFLVSLPLQVDVLRRTIHGILYVLAPSPTTH